MTEANETTEVCPCCDTCGAKLVGIYLESTDWLHILASIYSALKFEDLDEDLRKDLEDIRAAIAEQLNNADVDYKIEVDESVSPVLQHVRYEPTVPAGSIGDLLTELLGAVFGTAKQAA